MRIDKKWITKVGNPKFHSIFLYSIAKFFNELERVHKLTRNENEGKKC